MSTDATPQVRTLLTSRHMFRQGLAFGRAVVAVSTAIALVGAMAWVTIGRLDVGWPVRNVVEDVAWRFAREWVLGATPDPRPPGSIAGRVTWRVTDASTTPQPTGEASKSPTPSRGGAVLTPSPGPTPTGNTTTTASRPAHEVPVSGAVVLVVDADGNAIEARTDQTGEYVLDGLYPGRYRVVAAAPGFAPVIVDRMPDASHAAKLFAWILPGIDVRSNATATLPITIERPSPPPVGAFARDVVLPDGQDTSTEGEHVGCSEGHGSADPTTPSALRLPVGLTGAVADAPVASLRRYAPLPADRAGVLGDAGSTQIRRDPRSRPATVVAVVPVGFEEEACAAIQLASRGIEVVVAGVAPAGRLDRQVLAVRTLMAAMRGGAGRPAQGAGIASADPGSPPITKKAPEAPDPTAMVERGPIVVAAGWTSAIVMRAVADEAADVPMNWTGVPASGRAPPGSEVAARMDQRRAAVGRRIGGIVLIAPVLDLFAVRRETPGLGLPTWLAEAVTALGPADRELQRYVRYSARFGADTALPPVVIVPGESPSKAFEPAVASWARFAGTVDVRVEVLHTTLGTVGVGGALSIDAVDAMAVLDRVLALGSAS